MVPIIAITGAAPASAHTVLTATDPAADATLSAGPTRVSATFNEDLQTTFAAMTVVGPDGNLWSSGETEVRGPVASVGVRPLGPSGRYTVNYRVTSDDGHVVSGSWAFTVTVPSTGAPGPSVSGTAESQRISLWPFIIGAGLLAAGLSVWMVRRRS
jgi:hypothetical protein